MQMKQLLHQSHDKKRFGRLVQVLESETGHTLLATAEGAKIALTDAETHNARLDFMAEVFTIPVTRPQFEAAIQDDVDRIAAAAWQCLREAGIGNEAIELVILTGGSTEVHSVQATFRHLFPNAAIADDNKLSSVGLGLAFDSRNKFGGIPALAQATAYSPIARL